MVKLKILIWDPKYISGEPEVEVIIPSYLVKWAPRMMRLMPKAAREEVWGTDLNWDDFNLEELMREAIEHGETELIEVKSKEGHVKIHLEE